MTEEPKAPSRRERKYADNQIKHHAFMAGKYHELTTPKTEADEKLPPPKLDPIKAIEANESRLRTERFKPFAAAALSRGMGKRRLRERLAWESQFIKNLRSRAQRGALATKFTEPELKTITRHGGLQLVLGGILNTPGAVCPVCDYEHSEPTNGNQRGVPSA